MFNFMARTFVATTLYYVTCCRLKIDCDLNVLNHDGFFGTVWNI